MLREPSFVGGLKEEGPRLSEPPRGGQAYSPGIPTLSP